MTPTKNAADSDANIYALVPRRVVLNRMQTADCLESRVHWAIILCSWCGPKSSPDGAVVVRDRRGFIQKDADGKPQPAKAQDLLKVLGLAPEMKGNMSRAIARLKMKGVIRFERKVMYACASPPVLETDGEVATVTTKSCHRNNFWSIASVTITAEQLPSDPLQRSATVEWLNTFQNEHRRKLLVVNTTDRELLRAGLAERGILTVLEKKNIRGSQSVGPVQEEEPEPQEDRPTDPPEPEPEPPLPEPAPTIEEVRALIIEETAQTHSQDVPGDPVCRDTIANLQGAPVERLRRAIRQKFRPTDKIGRIPYLAKDVGDRWAMERQEQAKLEAEQRTREREALEWMAENEDESDENRAFARAKLNGDTS